MPVPRTRLHDKPSFPSVDLISQPLLAFRGCLFPRTQVIGIAAGKGNRGAEILPAKVNRDLTLGSVGGANEGISAGQVFFLKVWGGAAGVPKGVRPGVHREEGRTMFAPLPIHFDAEPDL